MNEERREDVEIADERPLNRGIQDFINMFQENKYVVLTILAACSAMLSTKRKLAIRTQDHHSANMTTNTTETATFMEELFNSNISAIIMMHFFLVLLYHVFVRIAQIAFGTIRHTEIQYTKESVIHFILMRCLLLASTLGPIHDRTKFIFLFIWLICLALLRAFLALSKARFEYLLTTPLTRMTLFQRLGFILGSILVCNFILAWWSQKLPVLSRTVAHLGWFEASLLMLKCLQLGAKLTFHTLENDQGEELEESIEEKEKNHTEWHEKCLLWSQVILSGVYVLVLVFYYLFLVSMDHFRVSFLDFILLINVKNSTLDLLQKMQQLQLYRQVIAQMDTLFPNANEQELLQVKEDVCVICLKPLDQAKKLTCGHLFHRICLRQCLQKATNTSSTTTILQTMPPNFPNNNPTTQGTNRQTSFFDTAAIAFNQRSARASAAASSLKCPICRQRVFAEQRVEPEQQSVTNTSVEVPPVQEEQVQGLQMTADVIRISTANLPRWLPLPNISLEIIRQVPDNQPIEELVARVLEVFPQWPIEVIQRDLRRTQSAQRTIENILSGRLSMDPESSELDALREDHGPFFSFFTDLWNIARRRQPPVANPTTTILDTFNVSQSPAAAPEAPGVPEVQETGSPRLNPQIVELNEQEEVVEHAHQD